MEKPTNAISFVLITLGVRVEIYVKRLFDQRATRNRGEASNMRSKVSCFEVISHVRSYKLRPVA